MTGECATFTFLVVGPCEKALKLVRRHILAQGLRVPIQPGVSGRIRKTLGIDSSPCMVLCVDWPLSLVEEMTHDDAAPVFLALHVIVTGPASQTLVLFLTATHVAKSALHEATKVPVSRLQIRITQASEGIAGVEQPENGFPCASRQQFKHRSCQ
jgi:hypothetical protein